MKELVVEAIECLLENEISNIVIKNNDLIVLMPDGKKARIVVKELK